MNSSQYPIHVCGKPATVKSLNLFRPCMREAGHRGGLKHTPDLTGLSFGNITVIELGPPKFSKKGEKRTTWLVRRNDGVERIVQSATLLNGESSGKNFQSGFSRRNGTVAPEYATVRNHRLYILVYPGVRPQFAGYAGMPFCDDWNPAKGGAFWRGAKWIIENLGEKPGPDWSLDIIEHDKGFVPGNLRWAQKKTQKANQQHRKLGGFTDAEFSVEAARRGYIKKA